MKLNYLIYLWLRFAAEISFNLKHSRHLFLNKGHQIFIRIALLDNNVFNKFTLISLTFIFWFVLHMLITIQVSWLANNFYMWLVLYLRWAFWGKRPVYASYSTKPLILVLAFFSVSQESQWLPLGTSGSITNELCKNDFLW